MSIKSYDMNGNGEYEMTYFSPQEIKQAIEEGLTKDYVFFTKETRKCIAEAVLKRLLKE